MFDRFLNKIDFLGRFVTNLQLDYQTEALGILPSIKNPRWLVPLKNKKLFISSLSLYQPSLIMAKLLKKMTVLAAKGGLPNLAIINRIYFQRNDDSIKAIFKRDDLHYAFFTGTEGSHRKVTVQVMDEKGTILGYIKVADNEDISELLNNEKEILRDLLRLEINSGLFPKVIYHGEIKGTRVLILDTLKSVHSTFSSRLSDKHINLLSEIFNKTARISKYKESKFALQIRQRLRDLETERLETERLGDLYKRAMDYIEEKIGDEEIPFGLCHMDFTPWNTFFHNGQLYVFDWEYAKKEYPPMLDIFHFIIQDGILVRHLKPEGLLKRVMKNGKWLSQYSSLVGIKENLIIPLLLCYLLDISLLYIEREKGHVKGNLEKVLEAWNGVIKLIV
ncbi:MAG: phosphotransferase [Thermoplasmata archaeon]